MVEIGKRLWIGLMLWHGAASAAFGQTDLPPERPGIPLVGRPGAHFYNAAGMKVTIAAAARPTQLATDEWLDYTLTVDGLLNAPDVEKPSLKQLAEFATFQINEAVKLDSAAGSPLPGRRIFHYQLRPSSTKVTIIPEVVFYYFDPRRIVAPNRPQDRFARAISNAVAIEVTAPIEKPSPAVAQPIPPFAERIAPVEEIVRDPGEVGRLPLELLLVLLGAPVGAYAYATLWRRRYPDEARRRNLRRNRAVRKALNGLEAVINPSPHEAAEDFARVLRVYLQERFELPVETATTTEVIEHLRAAIHSPRALLQAAATLEMIDLCRFGRTYGAPAHMRDAVEQLIVQLEEAA